VDQVVSKSIVEGERCIQGVDDDSGYGEEEVVEFWFKRFPDSKLTLTDSPQIIQGIVWEGVSKIELNTAKTHFMFKKDEKWKTFSSTFRWFDEIELNGISIDEMVANDVKFLFV
jgi:hypothetical protein